MHIHISVVCTIYIQVMLNQHTLHTHFKCIVWGCKVFGLREEGRREGEGKK